MTSKEALNTICLECQRNKGKIQVACPFRSISNEYCDEYEQIKKDLEMLGFIKTHYEMNGFNELIPLYLDCDDAEKFNEIERWLENDK